MVGSARNLSDLSDTINVHRKTRSVIALLKAKNALVFAESTPAVDGALGGKIGLPDAGSGHD